MDPMKKIILVAFAVAMAASNTYASSDKGRVGIGIVLGAPTGFSVKYWETPRVAWQGSIGGMFNGGVMIGADCLLHENAFRNPQVPFYYGPGVFFGSAGFGGPDYGHGKAALGIRAAFGVTFISRDYPFDAAVELGPSLLLTPTVGMGLQLSVAIRFYP
jgi:hypothetical protein